MFLHVSLQICFLGKGILAFLALQGKLLMKNIVKIVLKKRTNLKVLLLVVNIPEVPLKV